VSPPDRDDGLVRILFRSAEGWRFVAVLGTVSCALLGIGLVSSGTAALNEVMEYKVDGNMRRTAQRPLPTGRMSLLHATVAGLVATLGGSVYLAVFTNPLTGLLTFLTSVVYLAAYTPLKRFRRSALSWALFRERCREFWVGRRRAGSWSGAR
jgi:heme O synthase-like polyprenyltransferase